LPSIIRKIKSRRMRWARHVARMEEKRISYSNLVRNPEGDYWEELDVGIKMDPREI
jgi:hypothetical protein